MATNVTKVPFACAVRPNLRKAIGGWQTAPLCIQTQEQLGSLAQKQKKENGAKLKHLQFFECRLGVLSPSVLHEAETHTQKAAVMGRLLVRRRRLPGHCGVDQRADRFKFGAQFLVTGLKVQVLDKKGRSRLRIALARLWDNRSQLK